MLRVILHQMALCLFQDKPNALGSNRAERTGVQDQNKEKCLEQFRVSIGGNWEKPKGYSGCWIWTMLQVRPTYNFPFSPPCLVWKSTLSKAHQRSLECVLFSNSRQSLHERGAVHSRSLAYIIHFRNKDHTTTLALCLHRILLECLLRVSSDLVSCIYFSLCVYMWKEEGRTERLWRTERLLYLRLVLSLSKMISNSWPPFSTFRELQLRAGTTTFAEAQDFIHARRAL